MPNPNLPISQDEVNEDLAKAVGKTLLKTIPVLGNLIIDFAEARSRLEHKRIHEFVKKLSDKVEGDSTLLIDQNYLESEEFEDFTVHLLDRIRRAKTENARERLLKVLLGEMASPMLSEYMDRVINILTDIGDNQMLVLQQIAKQSRHIQSLHVTSAAEQEKWKKLLAEEKAQPFHSDKIPLDDAREKIKKGIEIAKQSMQTANDEIYRYKKELRSIMDDEQHIEYCLQDLYSKSLIQKATVPNRSNMTNITEVYVMTELGNILLGYVRGKQDK